MAGIKPLGGPSSELATAYGPKETSIFRSPGIVARTLQRSSSSFSISIISGSILALGYAEWQ